jgi:hypothetical protein
VNATVVISTLGPFTGLPMLNMRAMLHASEMFV